MTTTASVHDKMHGRPDTGHRRRVTVFADGADVIQMLTAYRAGVVGGFTTNPTLMARAGVTDYEAFGREILAVIRDLPISFEVAADDRREMARQARKLASWGNNVFVKIPITTTAGESMIPLVRELSGEGLRINVTAVMTLDQVSAVVDAVDADTPAICSVFAGRPARERQAQAPRALGQPARSAQRVPGGRVRLPHHRRHTRPDRQAAAQGQGSRRVLARDR